MTNLVVRKNQTGNRWLDPMFEDFFSVPSIFDRRSENLMPKTNIIDSAEKLVFTFEIPGMKKEDIKVAISDRLLTVGGSRESHLNSDDERLVREEILSGEFERQFTLPEAVRTDAVQAEYTNGILRIEFEKKDEVKPRQVEVKVK